MDVTITLGSWGIPALITIGLFAWAILATMHEDRRHGAFGLELIGNAAVAFLRLTGASIGSLISWLVWALLR